MLNQVVQLEIFTATGAIIVSGKTVELAEPSFENNALIFKYLEAGPLPADRRFLKI